MSEDRYIFKSGKSVFAGIVISFIAFIALLAVCCISLNPGTRFVVCIILAMLSFVINVLFQK